MSFGYQSPMGRLPCIRTYQDAFKVWANAEQWRTCRGEFDHRALVGRRNKNYTVRKTPDERIHFRLHSTDVVTVHPDSRFDLKLTDWSTPMTAALFHGLMPGDMHYYASNRGLQIGGRWYWLRGDVMVGPYELGKQREMLSETRPFNTYKLDRKAWNALRKHYKLKQLADVLNAYASAVGVEECADKFESLCQDVTGLPTQVVSRVASYLRGTVEAYRYSGYIRDAAGVVETVVRKLQDHLLRDHHPDILTCTTKPYLTSEQEFFAWRRSMAKWGD